jgi:predicted dithiol-disulfide oxidoreductase (DUF899 family)
MSVRFPGETTAYRTARDELLQAEIDLVRRTEQVAALRRKLPLGGVVREDYVFDEGSEGARKPVKLSELFGNENTLVLYSFMYGPKMEAPCPMCTSFLDGLEGNAHHLVQNVALAVTAQSPIARIRQLARTRPWNRLRLVSADQTTYQADYHGEDKGGNQWPMMNVFTKKDGKAHHFWGSEVLYEKSPEGQDTRHIDAMWPLWNVLDLTPHGRGTDWYPRLSYDPK